MAMKTLMLLAAEAEAPLTKWGIFPNVDSAVFGMFFGIAMIILVYVMIQRARAGLPIPEIRRIPGMEALKRL